MTIFDLLLPAFLTGLVLTGIHTYLGIHVITRGVIFVDIALAQLAAVGISIAFLMGFEPEGEAAYFFALAFSGLGAIFFALYQNKKIPQEALIGVTFAVSSALMILIADRVPHGSEHLKYILNGNILWVNYPQIIKTAVIYGLIGLIHLKVAKKLLLISRSPEEARKEGLKIKLWNLFFYLTFAMVITSSVQMAGVLLVFSYLIVPALIGILFFNSISSQLISGWIVGAMATALGLTLSYNGDLPTGATIVASFGILLILALILSGRNMAKGFRRMM